MPTASAVPGPPTARNLGHPIPTGYSNAEAAWPLFAATDDSAHDSKGAPEPAAQVRSLPHTISLVVREKVHDAAYFSVRARWHHSVAAAAIASAEADSIAAVSRGTDSSHADIAS